MSNSLGPVLLYSQWYLIISLSLSFIPIFNLLLAAPFCNDLMRELESNPATRVMWNSVKPMLMGRILYAPDSPAVRRVIKNVSCTLNTKWKHKSHVNQATKTHPPRYGLLFSLKMSEGPKSPQKSRKKENVHTDIASVWYKKHTHKDTLNRLYCICFF